MGVRLVQKAAAARKREDADEASRRWLAATQTAAEHALDLAAVATEGVVPAEEIAAARAAIDDAVRRTFRALNAARRR